MQPLVVHKGRTEIVTLSLGYDASNEVFTSQIREGRRLSSDLIAEWNVTFATDGTDGELVLTLDDSITSGIEKTTGFMDVKRVTGGEPLPAFDGQLEVVFRDVVTE